MFATVDRIKDQSWLANNWSPRKLPKVRDTQRIPRSGSGIELIASLIFGIWWLKILWTLTALEADGIKIALPSAWHKFFWAFLPVVVFSVFLAAVNLIRPSWTRRRRAMNAALNLITAMAMFLVASEFTQL